MERELYSDEAFQFIRQGLWKWWSCQSRDEADAVAKFICGHTYTALSTDGNLCRDNYRKFQEAFVVHGAALKAKALASITPV